MENSQKNEPLKESYDSLFAEVSQILNSLEKDDLPIDVLTEKIECAYSYIEKMNRKLFETETQIEQIINSRKTMKEDQHES